MKGVLRLAVDARDLASDTRGIGRYTRAILRRLAQRSDLELTLLVRGPFAFRKRKSLRAALRSNRFTIATTAARCDVVWHPANGTFFESDAPSVATVHDAVPFRFPDPDPVKREHQQAPFRRTAARAARVIAVSQFGLRELREVFALPAERITVIPHGIEPFFSAGDTGTLPPAVRRPYLLFVGDPIGEPRKNFALLRAAYGQAFAHPHDPQLVVAGPRDPQTGGVVYAGQANGDARGTGDAFLRSLYRGALALCVPSYYETFGMPLVEGMACGAPVIASRASCLPEIGGDAALYAPPDDARAWSEALVRVAQDPNLREVLREAGLLRARAFDWDRSARMHMEVFASV